MQQDDGMLNSWKLHINQALLQQIKWGERIDCMWELHILEWLSIGIEPWWHPIPWWEIQLALKGFASCPLCNDLRLEWGVHIHGACLESWWWIRCRFHNIPKYRVSQSWSGSSSSLGWFYLLSMLSDKQWVQTQQLGWVLQSTCFMVFWMIDIPMLVLILDS